MDMSLLRAPLHPPAAKLPRPPTAALPALQIPHRRRLLIIVLPILVLLLSISWAVTITTDLSAIQSASFGFPTSLFSPPVAVPGPAHVESMTPPASIERTQGYFGKKIAMPEMGERETIRIWFGSFVMVWGVVCLAAIVGMVRILSTEDEE